MKFLYLLIIINFLFSNTILNDNDFITIEEYGQMLYKNPRGIGCNKCHGEKAEGKFIISYIDKKNIKHDIIAPPLKNVSKEILYNKLKGHRNAHSIMPTYFLIDDEIKSLYKYLKSIN